MKLEDARKAYYEFSNTLSNINRQLALFGIAIIWFFVHPLQNTHLNLGVFKYSFILFCFALFFDLVHYASATIIWGSYHHYKEKKIGGDISFLAPNYINWFAISMLTLKVAFTICGYWFLIKNTILGNIISF